MSKFVCPSYWRRKRGGMQQHDSQWFHGFWIEAFTCSSCPTTQILSLHATSMWIKCLLLVSFRCCCLNPSDRLLLLLLRMNSGFVAPFRDYVPTSFSASHLAQLRFNISLILWRAHYNMWVVQFRGTYSFAHKLLKPISDVLSLLIWTDPHYNCYYECFTTTRARRSRSGFRSFFLHPTAQFSSDCSREWNRGCWHLELY